jgi:hypothetical protein
VGPLAPVPPNVSDAGSISHATMIVFFSIVVLPFAFSSGELALLRRQLVRPKAGPPELPEGFVRAGRAEVREGTESPDGREAEGGPAADELAGQRTEFTGE